MRCVHEASLHDENAFITLTYDDEHLPQDGSLHIEHFQKFMKRLRQSVNREERKKAKAAGVKYAPRKIRFYHCGEYGETTARPHYHALLFGFDFEDKELYSEREGVQIYFSPKLQRIWGNGFATTGAVTFESAAYVARYVMKKVTGEKAEEHYKSVDPETGEIFKIAPEYTTMSRRNGIGQEWWKRYKKEVIEWDSVIINGKEVNPPKYYDVLLEKEDPKAIETIKSQRKKDAAYHADNNTPDRLLVREKVTKAKLKTKVRNL